LWICVTASVRCPASVLRRDDFFSLNATRSVVNLDIFLHFSGFSAHQDSLSLWCSIVLRKPARHRGAMTIGLTLDQTLYKDGIVVGRLPIPRRSLTVRVPPNSLVTSSFAVSNVSLIGTDSVQLMIRQRVNFSLISGFMFHSMWANLAAEHYFQFARFILAAAFCFLFLAFFIRLKFEADQSSQILLLVVGICDLFSANPVGYALWCENHIRISDHFFSALFLTVYCLFLIWEFSRAKRTRLA
jgi:hypothetical protein